MAELRDLQGGSVVGEFVGAARNVVQIQHNHATIQFTAAERAVPWEIEPPVNGFVNRKDDLAWLCARRERVVVLSGMPGIGKSALARSFAADVRDRFPGGQFHIDRARFSVEGIVDVAGMVGACLSALGEAAEFQPPTLGERIQRFRTRTADRPCLILVENATEPAQVTALTPGNGLVLVTTQADLSELELDGAAFHIVRLLDSGHSVDLFSAACPGAPPQAGDLVPYAGGIPLAIKILAGRVRRLHDVTLDELGDELADDRRRLHALTLGGRRVAATFTASYERLPVEIRRLYRRLALLPGTDFTAATAAAVAAVPDVRAQLAALADAHLLERRPGGRYAFHDLIRIHARELTQGDPAEQREAALAQAVRHYLVYAAFADRIVMGARSRVTDHAVLLSGAADPFAPLAPPPHDPPGDPAERRRQLSAVATAWLRAERANLPAVVTAAHDAGLHEECWQLAEALVPFYYNHRYLGEWTRVSEIGSKSANELGNRQAEARLRISVSRAYTDLRDTHRATAELNRAEKLAADEDPTDPILLASIWEYRGRILDLSDKPAALAAYETARALNAGAGELRGVALCLYWHACTLADLDRLEEARRALGDVLERFESLSDPRMAARARLSLARVLSRLDQADEAASLLKASLATLDGTHYEAEARELLAELSAEPAGALTHLRRAWQIYTEEGNPRADDLLTR